MVGIRYNQDVTQDRNSYGSRLVTLCSNNNVCIFNGRLYEDFRIGNATTTHGTTVDYIIGSPAVLTFVQNFRILEHDPLYSDIHCGIHIQLKINLEPRYSEENTRKVNDSSLPGKWMSSKEYEYEAEIDHMEDMSIEELNVSFKNILLKPATKVFPPNKYRKYVKQSNNVSVFGYDKQCWKIRKACHKAKHKYNIRKSERNRNDMIASSKKYIQN